MRKAAVLALVAGVVGCSRLPPERQVVDQAVEALGGRDRVGGVATLTLAGTGTNGNLGQNVAPDAELPIFEVTEFTRTVDLAGGRARHRQTRVATAPGANTQPQVQDFAVDGEVAFNLGADGEPARQTDLAAKDRRAEYLLHHPLGAVRAAMDPAAQLTNLRNTGSLDVVDVKTPRGDTFTLALDVKTHLPSSVTSMTYHTNLGDVALETAFADYQEVEGLMLPARLTTRIDQYPTAEYRIASTRLNVEAADLTAPDAVKAAPPPAPTATVVVEEVGRGLWLLAGQSHHSVLVEFADHTELIEVPQNETRTLAVIARARELRPDKPLTRAIVTHHHFDHSGGIRAAIAEGLTLVTHEGNREFFEELAARTHSIVPDALARAPQPVTIETVGDEAVVKDATQAMQLYHVRGSDHSETMLMAYFPAGRVLVQADLLNPANPNPARLPNLLENIRARKLTVSRHVPIHGPVMSQAEFARLLRSLKIPAAGAD